MSNKYIEKSFLYFLLLSAVLHLTALAYFLFVYKPAQKLKAGQEPYMIELADIPTIPAKEAPKVEKQVKRQAERKQRVARQTAPRGDRERDKAADARGTAQGPPYAFAVKPRERKMGKPPAPRAPVTESRPPVPGGSAVPSKAKPLPELSKLYPSAERIARLEESYRRKYDAEIEQGDTVFLNTDDIQFGSFLRRFETAVYGVWRYPAAAVRAGIQGVTPVKITFSRNGEIEKVQILRSSGSSILDDEVLRTLNALGPLGGFPKGYTKDHFNLIAFFQYGLVQGLGSGRLH